MWDIWPINIHFCNKKVKLLVGSGEKIIEKCCISLLEYLMYGSVIKAISITIRFIHLRSSEISSMNSSTSPAYQRWEGVWKYGNGENQNARIEKLGSYFWVWAVLLNCSVKTAESCLFNFHRLWGFRTTTFLICNAAYQSWLLRCTWYSNILPTLWGNFEKWYSYVH